MQHERRKGVYAHIFFGVVFILFTGCRTTGSAALNSLTDQQADTALIAAGIQDGSAAITADLKAIEPTAGRLEPVIRAVRIKAEKLETDAGALTVSLAKEREITGKAREAVAETEEKAARYERQRNTIGGIFAGIILVVAGAGAVMVIKKRGFL